MDDQILRNYKENVIRTFGHNNTDAWRHSDFEHLSDAIYQKTGERISSKTLKRIFGKEKTDDNYAPYKETMHILCRYAGLTPITPTTEPLSKQWNVKKWVVATILFVAMVLVVFLFALKRGGKGKLGEVKLDQISGSIPWSAYFNVKMPTVNDSIFINFGDKSEPKYLPRGTAHISHLYSYPDIYNVFLSTRNEAISDTITVFGNTNGWLALAFTSEKREKTYPIPIKETIINGYFNPNNQLLASCGLDTIHYLNINLYKFQDFQIDGNAFILEYRVKNVGFWPEDPCLGVMLKLQTTDGMLKFHFNNKGCTYWLDNIFSEVVLDGEKMPLTQFNIDFSDWRIVRIENKNQHLFIYIDNKLVYKQHYTISLGKIVGIHFKFVGNGWIDYVRITDLDNKLLFSDEFNAP